MCLFKLCFKENGAYLKDIADKCNVISMSDYIGSDIGIIINILKLINLSPISERGIIIRELLLGQYRELIRPVLFNAWISETEFISTIRDRHSIRRNVILMRLSQVEMGCHFNTHNALIINLLIGILSGIPINRTHHRYDEYFLRKIRFHNKTIHNKSKNLGKRYASLKLIIKELASLSYDDSACDADLIDTVTMFVSVHLLINILSNNPSIDSDLSRILFDSKILSNELINALI